jgi:UDP-N-acetylmuramoylalanine--D-glutamate ligase
LIILLGGVGKGQDFSPLSTLLHEADTLKCCIVFGRDAPLIVKAFPGAVQRETLRQAIDYADGIAEPGDIVLFSPACASFDQFKHYIQRGEFFSEAVLAL